MKKPISTTIHRALSVFLLVTVVVAQLAFPANRASADQIVTRSLTLQAADTNPSGLNGGSRPSGAVPNINSKANHVFTFTLPSVTATPVGSIKFEYCTTAADVGALTCVAPTGLDSTTATLGTTSGITGLTKVNGASVNVYYLTRSPGSQAAVPANTAVTVNIKDMINPSVLGTFFVRISTYNSLDTTGAAIDRGTVAASTADPIELSGVMPESLVFCTGATVSTDTGLPSGVPDCSTATDGIIQFNKLFSPTDTAYSLSQMAASTNAGSGYTITVNGPTLTSGSNTIAGMATRGTRVRGTAQFGLNLVANNAAVSAGIETVTAPFTIGSSAVVPAPNGTNLRGQPTTDYGVTDEFKFVDGNTVAQSDDGSLGASDAQIYTVSYIANVPGSQPAGTYSTTLTYICTPTF
ncbi:hypothetical protein IPM09_05310 [Candidatus Saccharibacteria bacterium]|nr:MAG: hypothetical protein IPM09_05310 [Candidatus Saccharibacteria bacterium]